uniref:Uncharacterized protein n=1 Tax=Podarcis muralis TaxID=64176 RepID=A0A670IY60_PODMU
REGRGTMDPLLRTAADPPAIHRHSLHNTHRHFPLLSRRKKVLWCKKYGTFFLNILEEPPPKPTFPASICLRTDAYTIHSISQERFLDELERDAEVMQARRAKASAE